MGQEPPKLVALPLPYWFPEPANGRPVQLYVKGKDDATAVHPSDVKQGAISDCFFVAALSAVVQSHPDPDAFLRDIIKDNGDGTYTVTFFDRDADGSTSKREVTVNSDFYERSAWSDTKGEEKSERWQAVVERAYVKAYGTSGTIKEGNPGVAMEQLTGLAGTWFPLGEKPALPPSLAQYAPPAPKLSIELLAQLNAQGYATTLLTFDKGSAGTNHPAYNEDRHPYSQQIRAHHTYYVTKVDVASNTVTVRNPWDQKDNIVVPYDQLDKVFAQAQTNPVKFTVPPPGGPAYPTRH